ncbi:MAG TPA: 3-hydroxyacyl-CoA dehydrogenase NAD-binding domain-containing protein [Chthoniobacterales bacterium]
MNAKENIRRESAVSGVVTLTFDRAGSSVNLFDRATLDELSGHLDFLEAEPGLKGLVLRSAKPKIFIAGADLKGFGQDRDPQRISRLVDQGQRVFDRIARLPFPTVAAIQGAAIGGGLEIALACDYRVASSDPATKLGLPETMLGIIPAWGGSTRLPRLIGLSGALEVILSGKQFTAREALRLGLVDAVAPPERLLAEIAKLTLRARKRVQPIHFTNAFPIAQVIAAQARRRVLAKTRGLYPAPLAALEVVVAGLNTTPARSMENERRTLMALASGQAATNLIRTFFLQERAKKVSVADASSAAQVSRVMVVGAGVMGAGIAQWLSARGLRVVLKEVGPEPLGRGLQSITRLYRDAVRRRLFSEAEARAGFDRILPACEDLPLSDVDMVVEAAVENLKVKRDLFCDLESRVPCPVLATNTSALSIDAIADGLQHPERVVGVHFFNPVHRMQLVEVVYGRRTSQMALATALQFVKDIGKLPVLVKDSPGFLVNRILVPYLVEAVRIFEEGYRLERIERLVLDFGLPMGPLRLIDEVGLDVAAHVAADLSSRLRHLAPLSGGISRMTARNWLGRKSGRGFYEYGVAGKELPNPLAAEYQALHPVLVADEELRDRLILVMVNEAARCLEEQVVAEPEDVDFGMIMGTGWAPFRGGPLRFADAAGLSHVVARLQALQKRIGPHFGPCDLLVRRAEANATFYPPGEVLAREESHPA